jgi:AcrR family transcriptional regulator
VATSDPPIPSRRERLRAQTLEEIQERALALLDAGGAHAVSLAAIAKGMGMSAPALYRYFESRDALLEALARAAYADLGRALRGAAEEAAGRPAPARLRAIVTAYRAWAQDHPRRYTMIFGERGHGAPGPAPGLPVGGGVDALLAAVLDLQDERARPRGQRRDLEGASAAALRMAVLTWTRVHGIVGLELAGVFTDLRLNPGLLLDAEVGSAVQASRGLAPGR